MTGHEQMKRQLTDLAAEELSPLAAWQTRRHLNTCAECRAEWERIQGLWQDLRGLADAMPPNAPAYPQQTDAERGDKQQGDGFYRFLLEQTPLRRALLLPALALCALLITALLPQTGPTTRQLFSLALGLRMPRQSATAQQTPAEIRDARLGEALLLLREDRYVSMRHRMLREIAHKYPTSPVAWAALIGQSPPQTRSFGIPGIPGEAKEPWIPPSSGPWAENANTDAAAARQFLEDARKAERADPDNAYFTIMRSYAHLSLQEAKPGIAAFLEASRKPYFRDYESELTQILWRANAVWKLDSSSLSRFPASGMPTHYAARLRASGRAIFSRAMGLEVEGKRAEALELRRALLDVGGKMQSPNASISQYFTGVALGWMSVMRPGGNSRITPPNLNVESSDYRQTLMEFQNRQVQEFRQWYNTPEAAVIANHALQQQEQTPDLRKLLAYQETHYLLGTPYLQQLLMSSAVSLFLLCGSFWTLFLGLIAVALARTRRIQRIQTLHPALGGVFLTFFAIPLWFVGNHYIGDFGVFLMIGAAAMVGVSAYQLFILRTSGPRYGKYLVFGASLLCLFLLWLAGKTLLVGLQFRLNELVSLLGLIPEENLSQATLLYALVPLSFPLLILIGLTLISWRERVSVSAGVVLGLRRIAFPIAALLALAFTLTTIIAAHYDVALGSELDAMAREGVAYYERFSSAGRQW